MILQHFWAYIFGYLVMVVTGDHPERFINMALTRGVMLWDMVRVDESTLIVKAEARTFKYLRHIVRRTRCRVYIRSKLGLPFLLFRFRRRKAFFLGAAMFCLLLFGLSSMVWTVDVTGTSRLSPALVRQFAAQAGLHPGIWRRQVEGEQVAEYLLEKLPDVAFAEVDVRTRSHIRIVEKLRPRESSGPCDLVAKKDGVIENLMVLSGVPEVKEGETVRQGQVLISGVIEPHLQEGTTKPETPAEPRYVEAKGVIRARIWYRSYGEAAKTEMQPQETGRRERIVYMKVGQKEIIILGPSQVTFRQYRQSVQRRKFPQWRNTTLPVEFITIEAREIKSICIRRDYRQALQLALDSAQRTIAGETPPYVSVADRQVKLVDAGDENLVRVAVTMETREDIGQVKAFEMPNLNGIPPVRKPTGAGEVIPNGGIE